MRTEIEPVRSETVVAAAPDAAFERFTAGIGGWWPRATHSVGGERCRDVVMEAREGGRLYEVDEDGAETEWGTVTAWSPPGRVAFTWHPGREPATAQEVEVSFEPHEDGTRIVLVHSGWEALGERGAEVRDDYEKGWRTVLGELRRSAA